MPPAAPHSAPHARRAAPPPAPLGYAAFYPLPRATQPCLLPLGFLPTPPVTLPCWVPHGDYRFHIQRTIQMGTWTMTVSVPVVLEDIVCAITLFLYHYHQLKLFHLILPFPLGILWPVCGQTCDVHLVPVGLCHLPHATLPWNAFIATCHTGISPFLSGSRRAEEQDLLSQREIGKAASSAIL